MSQQLIQTAAVGLIGMLATLGGILIGDHLASVRQRKALAEKRRFYERLRETLTRQGRN
ncbi:hypothetical protein OpiT1DRAFT_01270 [Opitutaceae bacterium TAV1]|nr:hypothetical protein OpiT1DRAFT_01270 [Opitutaceae bacterium TAV1]